MSEWVSEWVDECYRESKWMNDWGSEGVDYKNGQEKNITNAYMKRWLVDKVR